MQCRSLAGQLARLYPDLKALNCDVLLVLGEPLDMAKRYAESLHLPYPVLSDPQRETYHLYGLDTAYFFLQRTASLVIDSSGVIRYWKQVANPMPWLVEGRALMDAAREISNVPLP
jgi:peroxiredoxin